MVISQGRHTRLRVRSAGRGGQVQSRVFPNETVPAEWPRPIGEVIDARTANLHFMWSLLYKHNECENPLVAFQNCLWTDERRCQTFG